MTTASEVLARRIIARLVADSLLSPAEGDKLVNKLASGALSQEDWRLAIELSTERMGDS